MMIQSTDFLSLTNYVPPVVFTATCDYHHCHHLVSYPPKDLTLGGVPGSPVPIHLEQFLSLSLPFVC